MLLRQHPNGCGMSMLEIYDRKQTKKNAYTTMEQGCSSVTGRTPFFKEDGLCVVLQES